MNRTATAISVATLLLLAPFTAAQSVSDVFKRVKDSVVVIGTTQTEPPAVPGGKATSVGGLGSGVLIDRMGVVLTAAHVVQVAEEIQVEFTSGEVINAKAIGSDQSADVALLKLEKRPLEATVAPLGDSDGASVGEQIFIVGERLQFI